LPRRELRIGEAIVTGQEAKTSGLPLTPEVALPFLLAARAQGEMAAISHKQAFFAQGLASSYEAFHHTRQPGSKEPVRDSEDAGVGVGPAEGSDEGLLDTQANEPGVPVDWYIEKIGLHIPDLHASSEERCQHPKVGRTVDRVVDLWAHGHKVLVFCFYRQTVMALGRHIGDAVERKVHQLAASKLRIGVPDAKRWLARAARNINRRDSLLRRAIDDELTTLFRKAGVEALNRHENRVVGWLSSYTRSPSCLARILPLESPDLQRAFEDGQSRTAVFERAADVIRKALESGRDDTGLTFQRKVQEFLRFAAELAERSRFAQIDREESGDDEEGDPLEEYFAGLAGHSGVGAGQDGTDVYVMTGRTQRLSNVVRIAHGDTAGDTRERLMCAFNSPIFPEVLVSSQVLSEGVDLHRFCRHVIHHDLDWNPSVLEQRTGRVDRIHCMAEVANAPIEVYQPFISGGADEKMFRVVKDRERWFQIVMGQRYRLDEATTEKIARRVPLPKNLAEQLLFRLAPAHLPPSPSARLSQEVT
jgi:hypothetical protein